MPINDINEAIRLAYIENDVRSVGARKLIANLKRLGRKHRSFKYTIGEDGMPRITVGSEVFDSPADAIRYIQDLAINEVDVFDTRLPRHAMPGLGGQSYYGLEELVKLFKEDEISIERISMSSKNQKTIEKIQEIFGGKDPNALMFSRDDTTTALRFRHADGTLISRAKILDMMRERGYYFDDSAKVIKRLTAITNIYPYGGTGMNINVAFFDPMQTTYGSDMMKVYGFDAVKTADGFSYQVASGRSIGARGLLQRSEILGTGERVRFFDLIGAERFEGYTREQITGSPKLQQEAEAVYKTIFPGKRGKKFARMTSDELIEVQRYLVAKRAVERSVDGQIFGSQRFARDIREAMGKEIESIEESLRLRLDSDPLFASTKEHDEVIKNLESLKSRVRELYRVEVNGGQFNVRIMNYVTAADKALGGQGNLSDELKEVLLKGGYTKEELESAEVLGQIKGNIYFIAEEGEDLKNWKNFIQRVLHKYKGQVYYDEFTDGFYGVDGRPISVRDIRVLAPYSARTTEFGTVSGTKAAQMGSRVSLQILGEGSRVLVDPQTLYADPELFDMKVIARTNTSLALNIKKSIESDEILKHLQQYDIDVALGRQGRPEGILAEIIEKAQSPVDSLEKRSAQRMLDLMRQGIGPTQNPELASMLMSEFKRFTKVEKGIPRLTMPQSLQAEIGTSLFSPLEKEGPLRGFISYKRGRGFIMDAFDYNLHYRSFGGFDLDDLLRSHMAWDRGSDTIHAIMKRSPGARGEIAVFKVDPNDELMDEILKQGAEVNEDVRAHVESVKLVEAKIKVKSVLQEMSNTNVTSTGEVLSENLEAMKAIGRVDITAEEIQLLLQGKPSDPIDLTRLQVVETLDELVQQRAALLGQTRIDVLRSYFEQEGRVMTKEQITNLSKRSLAVSDRGLGNLAKYIDLDKEILTTAQRVTGVASTFEDFLDLSVESAKKSQGVLGLYANFRMVMDSMIATADAEGNMQNLQRILDEDRIRVLFQEQVIDALTKEGGVYAEDIRKLTDESIQQLADLMVKYDIKIDRALIENEFGDKSKLNAGWLNQINERIQQQTGVAGKTIEDYTIEGPFTHIMRRAKRIQEDIGNIQKRTMDSLSVTRSLKMQLFSMETEKEADELYQIAQSTYRAYDPTAGLTDESLEITRRLFGDTGLDDPENIKRMKLAEAQTEFVREMMDRGYIKEIDEGFEFTSQGRDVLGALIRKRGSVRFAEMDLGTLGVVPRSSLLGSSSELSGIFDTTLSWFENVQRGMVPEAGTDIVDEDLTDFIRNEVVGTERSKRVSEAIEREMIDLEPGRAAAARSRAARGASEDIIEAIGESAPRIKRITMENLKPLIENKLFKRTAIAGAGLVAFSALYQKFKDRTPEDVQGPPLLPGGSFYDRDPNRYSQEILANSRQSGPNGVTYRVRAIGNFNADELSSSIEGLTGADVNSTTYQSRGFNRQKTTIEEAISNSFR